MHKFNPALAAVIDAPDEQRKHLDSPVCTPQRIISMPQIRINLNSPRSPSGLPTTAPQLLPAFSSPKRSGIRSRSRRISYTLKSRVAHYSLHLTIASTVLAALFLLYTWSGHGYHYGLSSTSRFALFSRSATRSPAFVKHGVNGVSLLTQTEDELIAEDDLFADNFADSAEESTRIDDGMTSEAERAAQKAKMALHREDVEAERRKHSLMALVWWLAEGGGIIPADWEVPSKQYLMKIGGRGMERLLDSFGRGEDGEDIFEEGWSEYAKKRYRIALFSKSYCPHSARAKGVFEAYRISPAPYVIELDYRPDYNAIQTLLKHLTGRRTVPNILLDFTSVGGASELVLFHSEGGLQKQLDEMEILPGARRKRAKAKADIERQATAETQRIAAAEAAVIAAEERRRLLEADRQRVLAEEEAERLALIEADKEDLVWKPGQDEDSFEPRIEADWELGVDDGMVSDVAVDGATEREFGPVIPFTADTDDVDPIWTGTETSTDVATDNDGVDAVSQPHHAEDATGVITELMPLEAQPGVNTEINSLPDADIDLRVDGSNEPALDDLSTSPQAVFNTPSGDDKIFRAALDLPAQAVADDRAVPRKAADLSGDQPIQPINKDGIPIRDSLLERYPSKPNAGPESPPKAGAPAKPPSKNNEAQLKMKPRADQARNADRLGQRVGNRNAKQADTARQRNPQPGRAAPRAAGRRMDNVRKGVAPNPIREAKNGAYALAEAAKAGRRKL